MIDHEINKFLSTTAKMRRKLSEIDVVLMDAQAAYDNGHLHTAKSLLNQVQDMVADFKSNV